MQFSLSSRKTAVVLQAEPEKEIEQAVWHVHNFLNDPPGLVITRKKIKLSKQP